MRLIQINSRIVERAVKVKEGADATPDELMEAINEQVIAASNSASSAANSANTATQQAQAAYNSAVNAGEEATIATQKAAEVNATYETAMEDIATEKQSALDAVSTAKAEAEDEVNALNSSVQSQINSIATQQKNNIQSLGIFMENNNLYYYDSNGVKREFRNDFGGIAPMSVKHRDIQKVEGGYNLTWTDPGDSTYQENVYCTWAFTLVVRKEGAYPESPFDGDVVIKEEIRNAYASTPYFDEVDTTKDYKYRAFPCSINNVYSLDTKNKFGVWCYGFTELMTESNPAKRIVELHEDAKYLKPNYMDFTNDIFQDEDWKNSPFYSYDYIRPVMLYNESAFDEDGNCLDGQVMEYLDTENHALTVDGEASHIADTTCNANAMVQKRRIFRKVINNGNYRTVYFSNEKLDEGYECHPCLRADGTYNEFYYTPMFDGALVNNKLVSLSGLTPISGQTGTAEIGYARNNGSEWYTELWCDIDFEEDIFKLTFQNTDSQSVLGQGKSDGGNSVAACLVSGTMITKGQNWGSSSTSKGVKWRYRENVFASQWQRFGGLIFINNIPYVKMTKHTGDGSTVSDYNTTGNGYIPLTEVPAVTGTSGGYQSGFKSTKYGVFSTVVSGSSSTYTCDGRWFATGTMYPCRGGDSSYGALCGLFCLASSGAVSVAVWSFGAALSYKPL